MLWHLIKTTGLSRNVLASVETCGVHKSCKCLYRNVKNSVKLCWALHCCRTRRGCTVPWSCHQICGRAGGEDKNLDGMEIWMHGEWMSGVDYAVWRVGQHFLDEVIPNWTIYIFDRNKRLIFILEDGSRIPPSESFKMCHAWISMSVTHSLSDYTSKVGKTELQERRWRRFG